MGLTGVLPGLLLAVASQAGHPAQCSDKTTSCDGGRSHSPLRGSPGLPPGSLLHRRPWQGRRTSCTKQYTYHGASVHPGCRRPGVCPNLACHYRAQLNRPLLPLSERTMAGLTHRQQSGLAGCRAHHLRLVWTVPAPSLAARAALGKEASGQDEQAGPGIDVSRLSSVHRRRMSGEHLSTAWCIDRQTADCRECQWPRCQGPLPHRPTVGGIAARRCRLPWRR
jgi:hypothetical protein